MNQVNLKVTGMRCGMCEAHICDIIRKEYPDAKAVKANHGKNHAEFRIGRDIDENSLKAAINETGYNCQSVEVAPYEKKGLFHRG